MSSRPWEPEARDLSVVFIVGAPRSGTTLLYRSLQHHPSFKPAAGYMPVESHAIANMMLLFGPGDVRQGLHATYLGSVEALMRVARDIEPLALRRKIVRRATGPRIRQPAIWKAAGEHHVLRRYFLEAHRSRGAKRLAEKTPSHIAWVRHLAIAFPDARFLYIARHPIDVYSSYIKRYRLDPEGSGWANLAPSAFAAAWERATRKALDLHRTDRRFLLVRYEDFTTQTELVVGKVLDHLGEPFDEATLLRSDSEAAVTERVRQNLLKGDPLLFSGITETTKRWEEHIDTAAAQEVEDRLRATMELVGYEPQVATWAPAGD